VIALNKWDAVHNKDEKSYDKSVEYIKEVISDLRYADVS
jgi:predicted GTPase